MKKILKLQDHKHTAKLIDHNHTSYRGLFVVMAVFGIALMCLGKTVGADNYVVNARVAAPIPTIAAQITSPANQTIAASQNIVISGTCPIISPAVVVVLYRGDSIIGSSGCSLDGEFSGTFSLVYGNNAITPKTMTITSDYGPDGSVVNIVYPLPVSPVQPTTKSTSSVQQPKNNQDTSKTVEPSTTFQIKAESPFIIFKQNQSVIWKLTISGGESPYTILVDWGDGTKSTYAANSSGEQSLEHFFKNNKNTIVRVSVKDATGKEIYTSVAGVTFSQQASVASITGASGQGTLPIGKLWLIYALIVAMIAAFWFGSHSNKNTIIPVSAQKRNTRKKR